MENKLNQLALEQYAEKYSDLLTNELFSQRNSISGEEILKNIPVKQVGLFVLFNLFKLWKLEMNQLKSPYFNFDSEDVKSKLEELMNLLSKNIKVSEEKFKPLLAKAVKESLLLIVSPLNYYQQLVDSFNGSAPTMEEVKDLQRFIKINAHMRDALLTAWAANSSNAELFNKAFEGVSEPPQEITPLIAPFTNLLPLDINTFLIEEQVTEEQEFLENEIVENKFEEDLIEDDLEEKVAEIQTIHTQFSEEKTDMLADSLGFEATQSLKSILTINQKFMFVNDLFDGNNEDFNKVIDFLDTCDTKEVVLKFINSNYIQRGSWKSGAPQVKEFLGLIDKKFSSN